MSNVIQFPDRLSKRDLKKTEGDMFKEVFYMFENWLLSSPQNEYSNFAHEGVMFLIEYVNYIDNKTEDI